MPESPVTLAFYGIAEQVSEILIAKGKTLKMHMPESTKDSEATKGDLSKDERED